MGKKSMHKTFTENRYMLKRAFKTLSSQTDTNVTTRVNFIRNKKLEEVSFFRKRFF